MLDKASGVADQKGRMMAGTHRVRKEELGHREFSASINHPVCTGGITVDGNKGRGGL